MKSVWKQIPALLPACPVCSKKCLKSRARCLKKSLASANLSSTLPEPHVSDLLAWCWRELGGFWCYIVPTFHPRHCTALVRQIAGTEVSNPSALYCTDGSSLGFLLEWNKLSLAKSWNRDFVFRVFVPCLTGVITASEFFTVFLGMDKYFRSAFIASLLLTVSMIGGVRVLPHQTASPASWWFWCFCDILSLCHTWEWGSWHSNRQQDKCISSNMNFFLF